MGIVAAILRSHGWTRGDRKRVNGRLIRPWIRPQQEVEQEEELLGNVELIRGCIADQSWEMIATLTEEWNVELKSAVWNLLTLEEHWLYPQLLAGTGDEVLTG